MMTQHHQRVIPETGVLPKGVTYPSTHSCTMGEGCINNCPGSSGAHSWCGQDRTTQVEEWICKGKGAETKESASPPEARRLMLIVNFSLSTWFL